ncbi:UNVERIFIED_CONTAM: Bifunctional phosphatase IMPL2, chloroplastic [Sesamum calycinum]|uniref:Bifunctional phosphatase IMPL2, chloroplastic n=1 Tax=Sesamum calycinum TaxID=2727403 RepID=A0AAW2PNH3_9LAMI
MTSVDSSLSISHKCSNEAISMGLANSDLDDFVDVGNRLADAAGDVIRKYFRKSFDILDKEDLSPVTIADRAAEESMVKIIQEYFPSHAIYGEENGWKCKEDFADFVWVLDPIDGTKSFITGKPLFGTLIALLHKGKPVKVPLYGCDCYAYALLASGYVDLVVESGLKPYDFLSLIPVIEGAGGIITDWKGHQLSWEASSKAQAANFNVVAAGDKGVHQEALDTLQWAGPV